MAKMSGFQIERATAEDFIAFRRLGTHAMELTKQAWEPRRGDVIVVELDGAKGVEKRGTRPTVVVQCNKLNGAVESAVVAPVTTRGGGGDLVVREHEAYLHEGEGDLAEDSVAECNQLRAVDLPERMVKLLGWLDDDAMGRVDEALCNALSLCEA